MAYEDAKQRIIDFFKQSKGKSKLYLSDLTKAVPELSKKELKKVTTEMIAEGTLMYYSTGSTTMLQLPEVDVDAKLKG
ncbi:MAG: dissimilatory sulfite reductase D family protein [Pseudomonadota bacterium]